MDKQKTDEEETNPNLKLLIENLISDPSNEDNKFQFDYFINLCKQKQSDGSFLINLVKQLKKCVPMLDPKLFETTLINLIFFDIKWHLYHSTNKKLLNHLAEFLIDLNSAYTSLIYKCMTMLIKIFQITNVQESTINCEKMFEFSHKIIASLVKIAPTSKPNLVKLIDTLYPYMIKDTSVQESYIKNLLKITEYIKDVRINLFEICIQKILKIDVNCTREQIIESELTKLDDLTEHIGMKQPLADRLDVMMLQLLEYIHSNCFTKQDDKLVHDWEICKSIYKDLLFIFDKYILQTYGSSHVQFLMFYICSFRSILAEGFLDYLWKRFISPASCAITRQICSYYIGSFLARAKFVSLTTCVATLQLIVTWIHNYINKTVNNYSNFDLHRTFYALTQTLFYVVIFRHRQLFHENANETLDLVKSWKLNEIINSKLNPLFYCLPTVRKKFAKITYVNQVAYCYSIIDANNRISLPIVSSSQTNGIKRMFFSNQNDTFANGMKTTEKINKHVNENPLDSFFPFDPYLLTRSKDFISSIYQEFHDVVVDDDMDVDSDDDSDDENDEDTDDDDDDQEDESDDDMKDNVYTRGKDANQSNLDDSDIDHSVDDGDDF